MPSRHLSLPIFLAALAAACGKSSTTAPPSCDPASPTACSSGLVCEPIAGGSTSCVAPLVVQGRVFDLAAPAPGISGARVIALDADGSPLSSAATSGAGGSYEVAARAGRNADGSPTGAVTLRADAAGYETFPSGLRLSFPIDLSQATNVSGRWVVKTAATDVGLSALAAPGSAWITGTVDLPPGQPGVLVVAEPTSGAVRTGYADATGSYVIEDVAPGVACTLLAYASGVNYTPEPISPVAGQNTVNLAIDGARPAHRVSGAIQLVGQNQPANATSVILVPKSTYDAALGRGEAPPGLRAGGVTSSYAIAGVPDGVYVVLGGFENDGWVRDRGGGALPPPEITVSGADATVAQFKITGAVTLGAPFDAADPWTADVAAPTFQWLAYPSALDYTVRVIDALGQEVWSQTGLPGTATSVAYGGPPLAGGAYYQFQVIAYQIVGGTGGGGTRDIASQSEDLRGVFVAF